MSNDNQRNPNIEHDPNSITEQERESIERKVRLILSLAGDVEKSPDVVLTSISYALIHAGMECKVTFASIVKVLADMYDNHPRNMETNDD